jgi:hypothetical protein
MKTFQEFMVIVEGMTMDDFKKQRSRQKEEPPIRKRGGISAPEDERTIGGQPNRDNKDYWASVVGKNRDRGAGNKAKRRADALRKEEIEIEEGVRPGEVEKPLDKAEFKKRRRSLAGREASADARSRGHVDRLTGKPYGTAEAASRRRNLNPAERESRRRSAEDPD